MLLAINYNKTTKNIEIQGIDENLYTINYVKEEDENIEVEICINETSQEIE